MKNEIQYKEKWKNRKKILFTKLKTKFTPNQSKIVFTKIILPSTRFEPEISEDETHVFNH